MARRYMHYDDELTYVSAQELSLYEMENYDEESRVEESPACDQPEIFAEESCRNDDSNAEYNIRDLRAEAEPVAKPITEEKGSDLCRVKRNPITNYDERYEGEYGGYRKDILTENLNEREKVWFICNVCKGIMKEACVSESSGKQFCSCCQNLLDWYSKVKSTVPVRKMINTLKCSCPISKRGCEWLGTLKDCENHLDTCGYVYVSCKLKCGVVLRRNELEKHEKDTCSQRVVKCDHCKKDFESFELNEHLNMCPKMKLPCDLCRAQITREDMPQHLKHDCGMVQEICQLGCGVKLTRNELKIHVRDNCVQRKIACKYCYISVKFCDFSKHLRECPNVKVTCDLCSIEKYRKDLTEHLKDYCPENEIECPFVKYKCMTVIKRKDMDNHLEEKETKHLGLKLTAMEDLISKQNEKITKQNGEITKQREENTKQREEITKQREDITKQREDITKQREDITKQREDITKQREDTTKQNVEFEKKHCRASKEFENEKRRFKLLCSITNVTSLVWNIGNVTSRCVVSELYQAAGYSFSFKLYYKREINIVFPETTIKYDNPFRAKCHILVLSSSGDIMNCGRIEVKQKDLTRGCVRVIANISTATYLTLEIYLTMQ